MLELILSVIAILLLLSVAVYTVRRDLTVASASLSAVCVLLALIEAADSLSLRFAASSSEYVLSGLLLQSLLPATLLFCSFTLHRKSPLKSLSPFWWGILLLYFPVPPECYALSAGELFLCARYRI